MAVVYRRNTSVVRLIVFIISVPMLLVGAIFLAVGIMLNRSDAANSKACTENATAEVIEMVESTGKGSAPRFSFMANGSEQTVLFESYSEPPAYTVGQKVAIRFDPSDPSRIYVDSDKTMSTIGFVFMVIGPGVLAVGIILLVIWKAIPKDDQNTVGLRQYDRNYDNYNDYKDFQ